MALALIRLTSVRRLLKETGRLSISPMFVVGIYSGADKLGEGFGSSLKMAEYRVSYTPGLSSFVSSLTYVIQAAEDALLRLYLTRQPPNLVQLPTSTFPDALGSVYDAHGVAPDYVPVEMADTEVRFGSASKSGIPRAGSSLVDLEED